MEKKIGPSQRSFKRNLCSFVHLLPWGHEFNKKKKKKLAHGLLCTSTPPQIKTTTRLDFCHQLPTLNSHPGVFFSQARGSWLLLNCCWKGFTLRQCQRHLYHFWKKHNENKTNKQSITYVLYTCLYFRFCWFKDGGLQVLSKDELQGDYPFLVFEGDIAQKFDYVGMICFASDQESSGDRKCDKISLRWIKRRLMWFGFCAKYFNCP